MEKIALIGSGGSGKTTLANRLGGKLDIDVWHLDRLLWKPGWEMTSREEQIKIQSELVKKEKWIIDGNYNGTLDIRLEAADTIIFLDLSRFLCVYRVLKRMVKNRNRTRPDMREGCEEKIDFRFIKWVWEYPVTKKPNILEKLAHLPEGKAIVVLGSPSEIEQFLKSIE
ncbi:DNA topology modulation protein [Bacillus salacetis]|uniref:DNA topology modulation protein n=1 Tax=Bacillus salacetis TaxID=2315464 RepID=A0A3A1R495_9BACI|nr:DNA topology modulation protein [Bacillus salacetis]RIW37364.1 DNA topology modulation protein [Bacillus salacetis]